MTVVASGALAAYRGTFGGALLVEGDVGYDEARAVWNGDIDRRPAAIARCETAEQVASAITFARTQGLDLTVRGGGHNFAGHAVGDGALMIDLSPMSRVEVDPDTWRARCGGGTTWAQLDAATQAHGLATPGGVISHTGVAGLTLGGGVGWLSRRAGLSSDNLVAARMVTADGRILRVAADEHPEVHWAIRGGGGNFGVVTEFEFALHAVGPLVQLGLFFWPVDAGADVLRSVRRVVDELPEGVGCQLVGLNAPPAPFVPEQHHFAPGYALVVVSWGSPGAHEEVVAPIRAGLAPLFELVTPMPYTELQQLLDGSAPWGIRAYEKAIYLDELTDDAVDVIAAHLPRKASPMSIMPVFPLGGAYGRVDDGATAFGGRRASRWLVNIAAVAPDPGLLDTDRAWVRAFWDALRPHAAGTGSYVNFLNDDDSSRVRASYGDEKYERLAAIKARLDPDNIWHHNANIAPAAKALD